MTEAEWLGCHDLDALLAFHRGRLSGRKRRLLLCGYCRCRWPLLTDQRSRAAVEAAERFADGAATPGELAAARAAAAAAHAEAQRAADIAAWCDRRWPDLIEATSRAAAAAAATSADPAIPGRGQTPALEQALLVALLRDVAGNPFHPAAAAAPWLARGERAAARVARAVYDERAFDRLPVLADALEEGGCDNEAILAHCRSGAPHARGCWVIDLLLGRE